MDFTFTRIVADEQGDSHFESFPHYEMREFWPGITFSGMMPAEGFFIESFEATINLDWHNPPDNQRYVEFFIAGSMGIEVSDGEKKTFSAGDALFFEDLTGKGHRAYGVSAGQSVILKL